jgi:4-hydroxythreonine-4-phosphate dehydrogenase
LSKVRTSPDHGTAFDIAGKDMADYNSFKEAVYLAIDVYRSRIQYQEISENHCELEKIVVNKKRQIRLLDL